jgi:hypothetical protein
MVNEQSARGVPGVDIRKQVLYAVQRARLRLGRTLNHAAWRKLVEVIRDDDANFLKEAHGLLLDGAR